jgi:hypothetical protein
MNFSPKNTKSETTVPAKIDIKNKTTTTLVKCTSPLSEKGRKNSASVRYQITPTSEIRIMIRINRKFIRFFNNTITTRYLLTHRSLNIINFKLFPHN